MEVHSREREGGIGALAKKFRFLRCPNCKFEHLMFGKETCLEAGRFFTPWNCPLCSWSGEVLGDRTMTRKPPDPQGGSIPGGSN
jgi:hypothetical protein